MDSLLSAFATYRRRWALEVAPASSLTHLLLVSREARRQKDFDAYDLMIQRLARVLVRLDGNIVVGFSVLAIQGHHRDANDREDETQAAGANDGAHTGSYE